MNRKFRGRKKAPLVRYFRLEIVLGHKRLTIPRSRQGVYIPAYVEPHSQSAHFASRAFFCSRRIVSASSSLELSSCLAIFAVASSAARFLGDALALGEARASVLTATALVVTVATSSTFCAFLGGEALTLAEALTLGGEAL